VSVIVPALNEEKYIGQTLASLVRQDYPDYEVIVVDDGSTDRTREIAEYYARRFNQVKVYVNSVKNNPRTVIHAKPVSARRLAIMKATGDAILHFTAHARAPENFISVLVSELEKKGNNVGCVGCEDYGNSFFQKLWLLVRRFPKKDCYVKWVGYGLYRREVLEALDVFPSGGDCELNILVNRLGLAKWFTTKTKIEYIWHERGVWGFFKRMFVYGNARARFFKTC